MGKGCPVLKNLVALIGRICISLVFIVSGITHIMHHQEIVAMLPKVGITNMYWLFIVAIVLELLGGALVFLGWFTRFGALLLIIFAIIVGVTMHMFVAQRATQMAAQAYRYFFFLKDLAIFGGLLYLLAFGSGQYGFDRYRHRTTSM